VLSTTDAIISNSNVTTTGGDVTINAENTSLIDARTLSSTTSGDTGVGVTLAFNTIGWESQNVLFNTVDALIGDPLIANAFGNQSPADARAYIIDSSVDSAGAINLTAKSDMTLNAVVTNETTSAAYALKDASSLAVGAILVSNMVNSAAYAYIDSTSGLRTIDADGGVNVFAQDDASILANSKLAAISSTTNDAGISLLTQFADNVIGEYQFTDRSGVRDLKKFNQVRLDDIDFTTLEEPDQVVQGDRVKLEFDCGGGTAGEVYEYVGAAPLAGPAVDLDGQTFTDGTKWQKLDATSGGTYRFIADDETSVNLATENYMDITRWLETISVDPRDMIPGLSFNISDSDSMAFGGMVLRNDVRSDVAGYINKATLNAGGTVDVHALESAEIRAQDVSTVTSSGGSAFGGGKSIAVNGVIATNLVLSKSNAYVTNGSVTTTNEGDVKVAATNDSVIDASILSSIKSNGYSIGVTLAFNTIGWASQNILFNTIDAIIGTDIGTEIPAETKAYIDNTTVNAAGGVSVTATATTSIDAVIENSISSISASLGENTTVSVGAVVSMNKISTDVEAFIDHATEVNAANGDITVQATDGSTIDSTVSASSLAVAVGVKKSTAVSVGVTTSRNDISNDVLAYISNSGSVATPLVANNGQVLITVAKDAVIDATATATAIAIAAGFDSSPAVSGGGTLAFNTILGRDNAYIANSTVVADGNVTIDSDSSSKIEALVCAAAVSVAIGASPSAVAIGLSVARNFIGWDSTSAAAIYTTDDIPTTLTRGETVSVVDGALSGDVYEYIGSTPLTDIDGDDTAGVPLAAQNFGDRDYWRQVNRSSDAAEVKAYIADSSVTAGGILTIEATGTETIDAAVMAGAAGVAASGKTGVSVSAAGVYADNEIQSQVQAYIDGSGSVISADSISIIADDSSGISAFAGAASLAASLSGNTGVSVAVGLSLAFNEISNDVDAFVRGANVTTDSGDLSLSAESKGKHLFDDGISLTAAELDDAAHVEENNPDDPDNNNDDVEDPSDDAINEAEVDVAADAILLDALRTDFEARSVTLVGELRLSKMAEREISVPEGEEPKTEGISWALTTGGGLTYFIEYDPDANSGTGKFSVSQGRISFRWWDHRCNQRGRRPRNEHRSDRYEGLY